MKTMGPDEGWDWLVKKTRRAPLCSGLNAAVGSFEGTVIRQSRPSQAVGVALFLGIAAVGLAVPGIASRIFGIVFALLTVFGLLYRFRVVLDAHAGVLTVVRGLVGLQRVVTLPRDKLELTRTVIGATEDGGNERPAGAHVLRLMHVQRAGVVDMLLLYKQSDLPPVARALTEFFAGRVAESAKAHAELADGSALDIPRAPTSTMHGIRQMTLTFPAPRRAVFEAPLPCKMLWEILGVSVVPVVALGGAALFFPEVLFLAVAALGLAAAGGVVMLALLLAFPQRRIGADLEEGVLYVEGLRRRRKREWSLADVVGVQLCAFHVHDGPPGQLTYEGNVILRDDAERVRMWTSDDKDRAARDARRFAAFIGKPFWDHT